MFTFRTIRRQNDRTTTRRPLVEVLEGRELLSTFTPSDVKKAVAAPARSYGRPVRHRDPGQPHRHGRGRSPGHPPRHHRPGVTGETKPPRPRSRRLRETAAGGRRIAALSPMGSAVASQAFYREQGPGPKLDSDLSLWPTPRACSTRNPYAVFRSIATPTPVTNHRASVSPSWRSV